MKEKHSRIVTLKHLFINQEKKIGLKFYPNKIIQTIVKGLPQVKWSKEFEIAYIPNTTQNIDLIFDNFRQIAWVNCSHFYPKKISTINMKPISVNYYRNRKFAAGYRTCPEEFYQKLELKNYSLNTARIYISMFEIFINHHGRTELNSIDENSIRNYLLSLVREEKSESYINQMINSIKFYYEVVMEMPNRFYSIERPQKKQQLPKVISKEEIGDLIQNTNNIKHKCIISLLYSAGLRRGELLNLKLEDIDSKRMVITINGGKGGKDRITLLSESVLNDLRIYYKEWKPNLYLFEGKAGVKYSGASVVKIVQNAAVKANIRKTVTPHMLRHSFATHLLEDGTDLRYIQVLLGHNSTQTTEIYTQVATTNIKAIKSPIDSLYLQ